MASYINGVTDFIPQLQPFKPNLNYYANILQTSQSQYDAAHKQISQAYGVLLNSSMLRDGNIQRRDQFFKNIEQDIKKISKLDLSQEHNVTAAMQAFRPLYEDKHIVKDMTYTKQLQNEMGRAENFRNCVDPDKCGGQFWQDGVKAMNYQAEEFKNAGDDESLNYEAPKYKPFVNVTKQAIKAAKDAGFNISMDKVHGGYIVTDTNGHLLTGTQKEPGILPNFLYGLFKDDQKTMDVFHTQAYVARKDFSKSNAAKYGSEDAAEQFYINNILHSSIQDLTKDAEDSKNMYDNVETQASVLKQGIKQDGGLVQGSPEDSLYQAYQKILQSKQAAEQHHNTVQGMIETAAEQKDVRALRQRVDGIVAMNGFRTTIWNAANEYAMGTQKQEIKADPYAMENVKFQHELQGKDYDFSIWQQKKTYEKNETLNTLLSLGLSPEQAALELAHGGGGKGIAAARLKELKKLGAGKGLQGKDVVTNTETAGGMMKPTVVENDETFDKQAITLKNNAAEYLKQVATTLRDKAGDKSLDQSVRTDAENILRNIFKGTKFNVNGFLGGQTPADDITNNLTDTEIVGRYKTASNSAGQVTSKYWNNHDLELMRSQVDMQNQTLANMNNVRMKTAKGALEYLKQDLIVEGKRGEDYQRSLIAYASLIGDGGIVKDRNTAANSYVGAASRSFTTDPDRIDGKTGITYKGKTASQKAREFFLDNYDDLVGRYNKAYHDIHGQSFKGTSEFNYEGGAPAVQKSKSFTVIPEQELAGNTSYGEKVVDLINDLPKGGTILVGNNPEQAIQNFAQDLATGDPLLKKYGYTVTTTRIPYKNVNGNVTEERIEQKITPNTNYVKSTFASTGVKYDSTKDYSFYVQYPANQDPTGYAQLSDLTGTQAMMNLPGSQLNYSARYGSFTLKKNEKGNGYSIAGTQPVFDKSKGEMVNIQIDPKMIQLSPELDAESAYLTSVSFLQNAYDKYYEQAKQEYIAEYKKKNAKPGGK